MIRYGNDKVFNAWRPPPPLPTDLSPTGNRPPTFVGASGTTAWHTTPVHLAPWPHLLTVTGQAALRWLSWACGADARHRIEAEPVRTAQRNGRSPRSASHSGRCTTLSRFPTHTVEHPVSVRALLCTPLPALLLFPSSALENMGVGVKGWGRVGLGRAWSVWFRWLGDSGQPGRVPRIGIT